VPRSEGDLPPHLACPDNRPSEHSGENQPEFADDTLGVMAQAYL